MLHVHVGQNTGDDASQLTTIDFEGAITIFYPTLLANQQPLGKEFEKVLFDNLYDLYVREGEVCAEKEEGGKKDLDNSAGQG
jgi:hypothetical protein